MIIEVGPPSLKSERVCSFQYSHSLVRAPYLYPPEQSGPVLPLGAKFPVCRLCTQGYGGGTPEQGGPVILTGTEFPLCLLLRLTGLR
jgi:hypothetical protein